MPKYDAAFSIEDIDISLYDMSYGIFDILYADDGRLSMHIICEFFDITLGDKAFAESHIEGFFDSRFYPRNAADFTPQTYFSNDYSFRVYNPVAEWRGYGEQNAEVCRGFTNADASGYRHKNIAVEHLEAYAFFEHCQ